MVVLVLIELLYHDVGQCGVSGCVEPEIGSHHRRRVDFNGLQSSVNLSHHFQFVSLERHLGGEGPLR